MANVPEMLLKHRVFITVLIIFVSGAAGCISQQPEILEVNPVIEYNPLEGFYGEAEGMFTVLKGSIPEVKESLKDIVIKKAPQQSTYSIDDDLNFVVFRGVFSSGGYGIDIDRVERRGSAFTIYATYIDPGEGIIVGAMVTQPVAIIPIGRLAEGDYEARLRVTKVKADADGTKIIRKVIKTEKELSVFNFKVKYPEEGELGGTPSIPNIPKIGVESSSSIAHRGTSTDLKLFISGNNITKGTEISLDYETLLLHTDGHFEYNPSAVELIPDKKRCWSSGRPSKHGMCLRSCCIPI
ncbi:MAG: protease complex subunit PrcB family protein [Candidatus Methanoperedens sp.]|nr:protease complex subunit PrcB family protein [Candidatus Methanoperedens sp.]